MNEVMEHRFDKRVVARCERCGVVRKPTRHGPMFSFFADGTSPWWFDPLPCEPPAIIEPWLGREIVMTDVETEGLDYMRDSVIQIAFARGRLTERSVTVYDKSGPHEEKRYGVDVIDTFCSFVKPSGDVSDMIIEITKISREDLALAPEPCEAADEARAFLESADSDAIFAAFNASFDVPFVASLFLKLGEPPPAVIKSIADSLDPFIWTQKFDRFVKGKGRHKLVPTAVRLGIITAEQAERAHRADFDADLALRILATRAHEVPACFVELKDWQRAARGEWSQNFFGDFLPKKRFDDDLLRRMRERTGETTIEEEGESPLRI